MQQQTERTPDSDTPVYDRLIAESSWTPADLRPAFDLHGTIGRSYETVLRRHAARRTKARITSRRKRRRPAAERRLP